MSRYEHFPKERVIEKLEHLENLLREISAAPTEMEKNARIEHALAELENRPAAPWARQFIDYVTSKCENYF